MKKHKIAPEDALIMKVDLSRLQRNAVRSYNDLIAFLKEYPMSNPNLSKALNRLRGDILMLACLAAPIGKDISDEPGFELKFFEVPEEEEEY